jgi:hypothetical protein
VLKEKQYYYKRKKITITKELEHLKNKAGMLKDLPLKSITYTANLNTLDLELLANLG